MWDKIATVLTAITFLGLTAWYTSTRLSCDAPQKGKPVSGPAESHGDNHASIEHMDAKNDVKRNVAQTYEALFDIIVDK